MKKKLTILLIGSLMICATISGCKAKYINEDNKKIIAIKEENQKSDESDELKKKREQMPVMGEESIEYIEEAIGEYSSQAEGIAWFLSLVATERIVRAEMIEGELFGYSTLLEVENELGDVYLVILTTDYYSEVIVKDSIDGEIVMMVTE